MDAPGVFWPAYTGMAEMAGGSEHAPEEKRGRGQAAVGQQARQTTAGQRGDHWGKTAAAKLNQAHGFRISNNLP